MAVRESPELRRPKTVLRTTGRMPTLSLVHDVIAGFGLEEILDRTGVDRVRLHRYRRGETWTDGTPSDSFVSSWPRTRLPTCLIRCQLDDRLRGLRQVA